MNSKQLQSSSSDPTSPYIATSSHNSESESKLDTALREMTSEIRINKRFRKDSVSSDGMFITYTALDIPLIFLCRYGSWVTRGG